MYRIKTVYNCYNDKSLDLNCKMLFFDAAGPGRSFQAFVTLTLNLDKALPFACSTWILFSAADVVFFCWTCVEHLKLSDK